MAKGKRNRADHRADLRGEPFVGLPAAVLYSEAYADLSLRARAILLELLGRFNGFNNGLIAVSYRELATRLGCSLKMIGPAIVELHSHGFIEVAAEGKWRPREARLYRLTFVSSGAPGHHRAATNEYVQFIPPKGKSRLPLRGTENGDTVPLRGTVATLPVTPRGTDDETSPVWGKDHPVPVRGTLIGSHTRPSFLPADIPPSNANGLECERCGNSFEPGDRGKPKRYCSERCRKSAEAKRRHDRQKAAA